MSSSLLGGCRCGAVRYDCSAEPFMVAYCHCRDCQYAAGGAASTVIIAPRAAVTISQGQTTDYRVEAESGGHVTRRFCGTCGSPLFSELSSSPELFVIKAGSLDDPNAVSPKAHIWTASAPVWSLPEDGLPRFEKNPQ